MGARLILGLSAAFAIAAAFAAPVLPGLRLAFGAVCHQAPDRCFALGGAALPVCARCLGVYFGALAAGIIPVRLSWRTIAALAVVNGAEYLSGAGTREVRFALAAALAWAAAARLLPRESIGDTEYNRA